MKRTLLTGVWVWLLLCAAGIMTAQASTALTFSVDMATNLANGTFNPPNDSVYISGAFNGWNRSEVKLVQAGSTTVFTNTYIDTDNANGGTMDYKFNINGNDETTACYDNRTTYLPLTNGANLVLPTPYYNDIGPGITTHVKFQIDMSEEIILGHWNPNSGDTVVIAGSFDGWSANPGTQFTLTNDPTILVTNYNFPAYPGGLVESNVYTVTAAITACSAYPGLPATNAAQDFKYVEQPGGSWESSGPADSNDNGNRFFANGNQVLPLVSFSDLPYTPLAQVTLNLDMSGIVSSDPNYVPNSVTVWGTFNNYVNGVVLTNNPAAANTNLYTGIINVGQGAAITYQYRYTNSVVNGWVYDFAQDMIYNNNFRRGIFVPIGVLSSNAPAVYFNDLAVNDYLPTATPVLFSVDMAGAIGIDTNAFNPSTDTVYVNGMFANYGGYPQVWYPWSTKLEPTAAPAGYQMVEVGTTTVYTNTILVPAGTPVALTYQYGIDPNNFNGGPLEVEAGSGTNHARIVRSTVLDPYKLPTDKFGNMYPEPLFGTGNIGGIGDLSGGNLMVGTPSAGSVSVSWLGRPGAHLQATTGLNNAVWQNISTTDGSTWGSGYYSTNGLVSVTNWPSSGATFFRLVKP